MVNVIRAMQTKPTMRHLLTTTRMVIRRVIKELTMTIVDKDVKKLKHLCIAGENIN
jgi:hypothetical protein